jgi:hypothetical protein
MKINVQSTQSLDVYIFYNISTVLRLHVKNTITRIEEKRENFQKHSII